MLLAKDSSALKPDIPGSSVPLTAAYSQGPDLVGQKRKHVAHPKFYCVKSGHQPGIYYSWAECATQVKGVKGALCRTSSYNFRHNYSLVPLDKSFTTLPEAEGYLKGEHIVNPCSKDPTSKFYAVRVGRAPGIYTDWPTAQKQITGWTKPQHKCFISRAEAQRFLDGDEVKSGNDLDNGVEAVLGARPHTEFGGVSNKKLKKTTSAPVKGKNQSHCNKETEAVPYEPGLNLPPGAEDGFDPNIFLEPGTGNVIVKTRSQLAATKAQAVKPAAGSMLRVYTDGSALRNGQVGAFAGVGVYFGNSDPR